MKAGQLTELGRFYNSPGFCDELTHCFLAEDLERLRPGGSTASRRSISSSSGSRSTTIEELIAAGDLIDAKTIAGLLLAARSSAHRCQARFERG